MTAELVYSPERIIRSPSRGKRKASGLSRALQEDWHYVKKVIMSKPQPYQLGQGTHVFRPDFYLKSNIHLPNNNYNSLKDFYLRSYFVDEKKKGH